MKRERTDQNIAGVARGDTLELEIGITDQDGNKVLKQDLEGTPLIRLNFWRVPDHVEVSLDYADFTFVTDGLIKCVLSAADTSKLRRGYYNYDLYLGPPFERYAITGSQIEILESSYGLP